MSERMGMLLGGREKVERVEEGRLRTRRGGSERGK
jgi:hypothetical protein